MTDTVAAPPGVYIPPPPETRRFHWLHVRHQSLRRRIIHLGYWSSIAFAILMLLTPMVGDHLYPYHDWIGFAYLVIQRAEINAEDHLRNRDVLWDHLLSSWPMFEGVVMLPLFILTSKYISPEAWHTLCWFAACAMFDFVDGVITNNTILNAPYQREDRPPDH